MRRAATATAAAAAAAPSAASAAPCPSSPSPETAAAGAGAGAGSGAEGSCAPMIVTLPGKETPQPAAAARLAKAPPAAGRIGSGEKAPPPPAPHVKSAAAATVSVAVEPVALLEEGVVHSARPSGPVGMARRSVRGGSGRGSGAAPLRRREGQEEVCRGRAQGLLAPPEAPEGRLGRRLPAGA